MFTLWDWQFGESGAANSRTLRTWREMNLLPQAPFVLDYNSPRKRRWLYPAAFVECLADIAESWT